MEPFDLDAAKAARAETQGETPTFIFGGQKFVLPAELPAEFPYLLDDAKAAIRYLLGPDQFDDFWAHRPSKQDIVALVAWISKPMSLGESSASDVSSPNGSSRSRPTSPATTRSTSAKRSSGRTQ